METLRFDQCSKYLNSTCKLVIQINEVYPHWQEEGHRKEAVLNPNKEQIEVLEECNSCNEFELVSDSSTGIEESGVGPALTYERKRPKGQ